VDTTQGSSRGTQVELAPGISVPGSLLRFSFTTSSGPGGQNVNKRATRSELRVLVADLPMASHRVTGEGELVVESGRTRSQEQNRSDCLDRLRELVRLSLIEPKRRRKTKPTKGSKERRLGEKKQRARTKRNRGDSSWD
jgi:ribosome-associated protein